MLVNNAANDERHDVAEVTPDYWDHAQNVNLRHHFFAAQAVHPQMQGARLRLDHQFLVDRLARRRRDMAAYATAKAAIVGLTFALARAFGPDNIRVNAIEPGAVMTERQRRLWYSPKPRSTQIVERQMIRRVLLGDEIARAVLFLAADDSRMITKQSITVDAGLR